MLHQEPAAERKREGRSWDSRLVTSPHLRLAKRLAEELVKKHGEEILGVGVMGSVGLGEEGPYSDVDLLVLAKHRGDLEDTMRDGIPVNYTWRTPAEAEEDISTPNDWLVGLLSGWRSLKILYDPQGAFERHAEKAREASPELFARSARVSLARSLGLLRMLRGALASGKEEAAEVALWFTGGAAGALACLLGHVPRSGKTLFAELAAISPLGQRIHRLRYGWAVVEDPGAQAEEIWEALLGLAAEADISVDDLDLE